MSVFINSDTLDTSEQKRGQETSQHIYSNFFELIRELCPIEKPSYL